MDNTEKRINETIQQIPDQDLYSIGDAQVASDRAKEKAYRLQHEENENTGSADDERRDDKTDGD